MGKKEFDVNFSGHVTIKASSKEEAEDIFWSFVNSTDLFNLTVYDDVWEIENIEEAY